MIRMVFCDLDGTLLPQGRGTVHKETLSKIKSLQKRGVLFCVASGRPYEQLRPMFSDCANDMIFMCLDGALCIYRNCVIYKKRLCKLEAARLLSLAPSGTVYGRGVTAEIGDRDSTARITEKINRLGSEVFKVALKNTRVQSSGRICYDKGGITEYVDASVSKGAAAKALQEKFSVSFDECAALGNGENDISLLSAVGKPYKMANCDKELAPFSYPAVANVNDWLASI